MENKQKDRESLLDQIFFHSKSPGLSINDFDNFDRMQNKINYKSVISFQDHSVLDKIFLYSKSPSLSFKPPDIEVRLTSTSMLCSWDQHDCYLLYKRHAKGRNTSTNPLLASETPKIPLNQRKNLELRLAPTTSQPPSIWKQT